VNLEEIFRFKLKELKLPELLEANLRQVYIPLYHLLIEKEIAKQRPLIIGICGAQGSGKTTFTQLLSLVLEKGFNLKVVSFSVDDFYLTRQERVNLSKTVHPLLLTRGVPGTHDVKLGIEILSKLKSNSVEKVAIPIFDKSVDDRYSEANWKIAEGNPDVILFEGWCVGAKPQTLQELKLPVNELEEHEDADGQFRSYVNTCLATNYQDWFNLINKLIMLKVPSFDKVFEWRLLQEEKLRTSVDVKDKTSNLMDSGQIRRFISFFERLTKHMLEEMPSRADVVFPINNSHLISGVFINKYK
jgi:D-glycerate 3-kinase